jgi:NAD-dependent deacetylase
MTDTSIDRAAALIAGAKRMVVTTGAGMSRESGIPTFRDAPSALWENFDPMDLATPEGFLRDPARVWKWYAERREMIARAEPHAGHVALAELESMDWDDFLLITQNIDNLHRKAGSNALVEIHGNILRFKCFDNHHPVETLPGGDEIPPRCECGSLLRPDVVWFHEMLPERELEQAGAAIAMCDVMLVVGTSGEVYPVAAFPGAASAAGASVIDVNTEETPVTEIADVFVAQTAGAAIPALVAAVRRKRAEQARR